MSWRDRITGVLMGKVGGPTPTGIHAYHSSPHDFERFENRLLTGEGANVYGAGTYLAENPKVSGQGGQYWEQFLGRAAPTEHDVAKLLRKHDFDRVAAAAEAEKVAREAKEYADERVDYPIWGSVAAERQKQLDLLRSGAPVGPRTYEVNFRAKPEELLDWDKPMTAQPQALEKIREGFPYYPFKPEETGQSVYTGFVGYPYSSPGTTRDRAKQIISERMGEAGIPGIRYLDEGSRNMYGPHQGMIDNYGSREAALANAQKRLASGMGDTEHYRSAVEALSKPQTSNYVAFDPSKLDIMAKYGVVGGVPLGAAVMGGTAAQDRYGAQQ